MKKLQDKNDKEKLNQEIMELYKKQEKSIYRLFYINN